MAELSVVLPCFDDEAALARNLPALMDHLGALGVPHEVLVVDDGSRDAAAPARVAAGLGCRLLRSPRNRGKGAAVRQGMLAARGRLRLFTDADVPYELAAIEGAMRMLDAEGFELVVGDRTLTQSSYYHQIPALRRLGSRAFAALAGGLFAGERYDSQCGLKAFRGEVAQDLFSVGRVEGFAFDVELLHVARRRGYRIGRLPVRLRSQDGQTVSLLRDGIAMLRDLCAIRWHDARGRYERQE